MPSTQSTETPADQEQSPCSSSDQFVPSGVDVDALCECRISGPLWFEFDADDSRCPAHLLAPQRLLPDGHPRKRKQLGSRMIHIPASQIIRD